MKKNDIIAVDYEIWIMDNEKSEEKFLLRTTKEELAKAEDSYDEKGHYEPEDFIIGKERPFKQVDESFLTAEVGKELELTIPPADAYGAREMSRIQFRNKNDLEPLEEDKSLYRGARVKLKNPEEGLEGEGVVIVNTGRRINVDFNHPLAGKHVLYKYTVTKKYEELADILKVLFSSFSTKLGEIEHSISEDGTILRITLPELCKVDSSWMLTKLFVVTSLRDTLDFENIIFEEVYARKKEEEAPEETEEVEAAEPEVTVELGGDAVETVEEDKDEEPSTEE